MSSGGVRVAWSSFADEVIESMYPEGGAKACKPLLPDRSIAAIQQRAFRLGITTRMNPAIGHQELWPRPKEERACDLALTRFKEAEPTQNLTWRIAA